METKQNKKLSFRYFNRLTYNIPDRNKTTENDQKTLLAVMFEMGLLRKMPNFMWKFNRQVWKQDSKYEVIASDDCIHT